MERLKPKLDIISKRLQKIQETSQGDEGDEKAVEQPMVVMDDDKKLEFHGRQIFDCLDANHDGVLSYGELNVVLGFDDTELENFVSRMQELGRASGGSQSQSESQVSRSVFIKYFLQVLEENNRLNVTQDEAAATYEEILSQHEQDVLKEKMLYTSSLSKFLSDRQIYMLIKVRRLP